MHPALNASSAALNASSAPPWLIGPAARGASPARRPGPAAAGRPTTRPACCGDAREGGGQPRSQQRGMVAMSGGCNMVATGGDACPRREAVGLRARTAAQKMWRISTHQRGWRADTSCRRHLLDPAALNKQPVAQGAAELLRGLLRCCTARRTPGAAPPSAAQPRPSRPRISAGSSQAGALL